MAAKPTNASGYDVAQTLACERVLVTLLRGLGPWKDSVYLVGGLTPRYLIKARDGVPAHAGSQDVDLVIDLQILTDTDAYATFEENLQRIGFERAQNDKGVKQSWRWWIGVGGAKLVVEFLAEDPSLRGGKAKPLPTEGNVSAINIRHASMVMDLHDRKEITAELLDGGGIACQEIRHANIVAFVCLKSFAYEDRREAKDAYDLVYCLAHCDLGIEAVAKLFVAARAGKHASAITECLAILQKRFCDDGSTEGFRKDGPVAAAKFELSPDTGEAHEATVLKQRDASALVEHLLRACGAAT